MSHRRIRILVAGAVAAFATFLADVARAGDGPERASDADASAALTAFDAAFPRTAADTRRKLVAGLAAVRHPRTSERLHRVLADDEVQPDVRLAAVEALKPRGKDDREVASRLGRWLAAESEAAAKAWAKGDLGVPVDRKTGNVDAESPEARAAIEAGKSRARVVAAGLRCAADLAWRPKDAAQVLRPLVHSAYDDLAVAALDTAALWKDHEALPDVLRLWRMYPRENRWETGAVVDASGTNASAQAAWNRWFGHPLKQRPRPEVHRAVLRAAEAIAGLKFETPEALAEYVESGAGKRRNAKR